MQFRVMRLGHRGDGVARTTEGEVFIPFALPGEIIEGTPRDGRIDKPAIVTPSPARVKPPCPHFGTCGGCALQHASDMFLARWKSDVVRQALAARGIDFNPEPAATSGANTRRRATLAGKRTKKGALVGFHGRASDMIVPIPSCTLLDRAIIDALPWFEKLVRLGGTRRGEVAISVTTSLNGLDIGISGAKKPDMQLLSELGALARQAGFARLTWNDEIIATIAPAEQLFGEVRITPPPGAFLQATPEGQNALISAVQQAVAGAHRIADLFAGCGTFSLPPARQAEVAAIEGDADALSALQAAWRATAGMKAITTQRRDLFRRPLLTAELDQFDAVVLDPPRAGAFAQAGQLATSAVSRVVHVSCNPVTFARDADILLRGGFRLDDLTVVDQFRWSPHVELVAVFSRR